MLKHFDFTPDADIVSRTRWYIKFRWFYILLLTVPTGLSMYLSEGATRPVMVIIVAFIAAMSLNGAFYLISRFLRSFFHYQLLAAVIPLADIIIITVSIIFLGDTESKSSILYVIPIILSAATLGRKGAYGAALASLVLYNATFLDDILHQSDPSQTIYAMIYASASLVGVLFTVDYILQLLRQKERQALKIVDDLTRAQAVGKFGSWEIDIPRDAVAWSDEAYRLIGLMPGSELTLERYVGFIHADDRRLFEITLRRARRRVKRFKVNYRIITANGSLRYFRAEGESLGDRSGTVVTIIGTVHDMTDERMLDQSKNEFVALASHQLRTPATIVKQYLAMLLDGYGGDLTDRERDFITTASDTNNRQIAIINNLLEVAQLESGKIRLRTMKIDLVGLLRSLVKEYQVQAGTKQQQLSFRSRYKQLYMQVDEYYLRTVLENIVDNALRYTLPNKSVVVRLSGNEKSVMIAVSDQGVGIAAEDMPKLFKKFSRIEHPATFNEQGTGLGLYWSDKVVGLHKGRLKVSSVPGKGSTFTIVLPRRKKAAV